MNKIYIEKITDLGFSEVGNYKSAAARRLLRDALSDFGFNCEPEFNYGPYGKPYLTLPTGIWFNLSHGGEYAACVVSDEREVGIDIQEIVPTRMNVAERVFSAEQCEALRGLDGAKRDALFCELWVLREAAIKVRGGSVLERGAVDLTGARLIDAPLGYCAAVAGI